MTSEMSELLQTRSTNLFLIGNNMFLSLQFNSEVLKNTTNTKINFRPNVIFGTTLVVKLPEKKTFVVHIKCGRHKI
jgi:hypothetical protein